MVISENISNESDRMIPKGNIDDDLKMAASKKFNKEHYAKHRDYQLRKKKEYYLQNRDILKKKNLSRYYKKKEDKKYLNVGYNMEDKTYMKIRFYKPQFNEFEGWERIFELSDDFNIDNVFGLNEIPKNIVSEPKKKESYAKYKPEEREKIRQQKREYYQKNKDKILKREKEKYVAKKSPK